VCASISVCFAGLARNNAAHLPHHLNTMAVIGAGTQDWRYILLENDSTDETPALLDAFHAQYQRGIIEHRASMLKTHPKRTARLAHLRNAILRLLDTPDFSTIDYLVMMDLDAVNRDLVPEEVLTRLAEEEKDWDGLFANQLPFYYDIWALRHPTWSSDDAIVRIRNRPFFMKKETAKQRFVRDRQILLDPAGPRLAVESAFGGLGLYDMRFIRKLGEAPYRGLDAKGHEICEHVRFHEGLRALGARLVIDPGLINCRHIDQQDERLLRL